MSKKYFDSKWDFTKANTKIYSHCFHSYPAMMIPQIAGGIIELYGNNAKLLFDPYCGTGTSLVEASVRGINSLGTDINPLARLIAKSKITPIPIKTLDLYLENFVNYTFQIQMGTKKVDVDIPNFKNIDYWFKEEIKEDLAIIKSYVAQLEDSKIQNFFLVAFSETVRDVSWTKSSEFKLFRMTKMQMENFNPDVFGIMNSKLIRNRNGLKEYIELRKSKTKSGIYDFNTVNDIPTKFINGQNIDLVVTSPPYGDSRTTVAYGQFSRLSNQWLGVEEANQIDNRSMGGIKAKDNFEFDLKPLDTVLEKIHDNDEKRVKDVISFYIDYRNSINNISKIIGKNGIVAYVVGNRKVKGVQLPTDEITVEFYKRNGFRHRETIIRNIPNKRMPRVNSPTNVVGKKDSTMINEYIVIMEKEVS